MFSLEQFPDLPSKYKLQQVLGEGAFSSVYKAMNVETDEVVAVKIINKFNLTQKQLANIHNEIHIMNTLANSGSQQNILRLIESFDTPDNCFLILEYCDGGEIFNKIIEYTYFSEQLSRHVFLQLLDAIHFLHQHNVVHRDIKPENLLFERIPFNPRSEAEYKQALRNSDDDLKEDEGAFVPGVGGGCIGTIKLADFGLAKLLRFDPLASKGKAQSNLKTPCGTAGYTAPEVIHCGVERKRKFSSSTSRNNYYSKSVDIWSLGCFLYTILCGFPPFYDDNHDILTQKIITANYVFLEPWWDEISEDAKDLISRMLVINPEQRITIEEIYQHPWVAEATPLRTLGYFPDVIPQRRSLSTMTLSLDAPKRTHSVSPVGTHMAGGLISPGVAIKQVFSNPAMSHVNLKLLAQLQQGEHVAPHELKFDKGTKFQRKGKSKLPRTPNPMRDVNFKDVFDLKNKEDDGDEIDEIDNQFNVEFDEDYENDYDLELELNFLENGETSNVESELQDKLSGLKYLSISSRSSSDSLKLQNDEEYATRSSSVISGMNGDYKFTLNLNDLNLLRRRSSTKSGNTQV